MVARSIRFLALFGNHQIGGGAIRLNAIAVSMLVDFSAITIKMVGSKKNIKI